MKAFCLISVLSLFSSASAFAAEAGVGRDSETPDASPAEPAPSDTVESIIEQLLDVLGMNLDGAGQ